MFMDLKLKPNIREGAFGTIIAMLKANQADIGLELEPNVSQAVKDGAHIVYSLSELYGDFTITGLTVSPNLINKNPLIVQRTVDALQKSLNFIHSYPDSTLSILLKRFPEINKDVAKEALLRIISENIIPKNLLISQDAWNKAVELRKEIGDLKTIKDFNVYVDNTFAQKSLTIK
jgi:NitT/TauT family transport system substrate-binding protein